MNKPITTFILGAGASLPYGFPLAEELRKQIINITNVGSSGNMVPTIVKMRFQEDDIKDFKIKFEDARDKTIDAFLYRFRDKKRLVSIAKIAITIALLECERRRSITVEEVDDDWFTIILDDIKKVDDFSQFDLSHLNFITFNYERSIEYLFITSLRGSYPPFNNDDNLAEALGKMNIEHVYGSFGDIIRGLNHIGDNGAPYGELINPHTIQMASLAFLLPHEQFISQRQEQMNRCMEILNKSDLILFFGFGYHKENLDRLQLDQVKDIKNGSSPNLGSGQIEYLIRTPFPERIVGFLGFHSIFFCQSFIHFNCFRISSLDQ